MQKESDPEFNQRGKQNARLHVWRFRIQKLEFLSVQGLEFLFYPNLWLKGSPFTELLDRNLNRHQQMGKGEAYFLVLYKIRINWCTSTYNRLK